MLSCVPQTNPMTENDPVEELLLRWKQLRDQGQDVSPEELCKDRPELREEFLRRLETLLLQDQMYQAKESATTLPLPPLPVPPEYPQLTIAADARPDSKTATPLPTIPGYEVLARLGAGGMGVV